MGEEACVLAECTSLPCTALLRLAWTAAADHACPDLAFLQSYNKSGRRKAADGEGTSQVRCAAICASQSRL